MMKHALASTAALISLAFTPLLAHAQKKYDQGATDTEIRFGNTAPYSGPASSYGTIGKLQQAYFKKINDEGGIKGRKLNMISLDDGYNPAKTVEVVRRLVEQDNVLFLFGNVGSPTNSAIQKYVNIKKIPHLFHSSGANKWNDPKNFPWSMAFTPNYQTEGRIYAEHILKNASGAKIAVLYQNDDFGKDYVQGLKSGLGNKGSMIVSQASYEVTDATINSQIAALRASGAEVFVDASSPKFTAQAIRNVADVGWKPTHYIPFPSSSVGSVLTPAGLDKSTGVVSVGWLKDPTNEQLADDPGVKEYLDFMKKYYPEGDIKDTMNAYAYTAAQALVKVLAQAGNNLTRDNIMKQAASLKDVELPMLLPGIRLNTSTTDYAPVKSLQPISFDGKQWVNHGEVVQTKP
ncbi:ABC transporter substrate-binding protein [Noviherbaspirillum pedocola]|uniref:ABC transporter substrate-binding protein n=1 Tax=Noviherbaspirillum pedocola TaxID=2801341 RepID=A0A934T3W1_9BURK|nr:ABC transporter substrate-binding protein [Noviherbaspirillum pedocola]MBK4739394.1 ABC transporter substrate-binding protein [Noviherbaspirillum pedocola]